MGSFDLQMRPSLIISLIVFLSLLPSNTRGIRLDKGLFLGHKKIHKSGAVLLLTSNGDARNIILCKSGHCTTGNNRKLITETIPSFINSIKNGKNGRKEVYKQKGTRMEEKLSRNSLPNFENQEAHEHSSESNVEIAEMDYSPASRKPPIHN